MAPEQPTDGSAAAAAPTSAEQQQAGPSTDLDAQIAQGMVDYQNQLLNIDEIRLARLTRLFDREAGPAASGNSSSSTNGFLRHAVCAVYPHQGV